MNNNPKPIIVHCRKCNSLYTRYSRWTKLCDSCWKKAEHENGIRVGKLGKKQ
ncbi:MAG: hypothetical protein AABY22_19030 [Nanoarchaeota archaeon]